MKCFQYTCNAEFEHFSMVNLLSGINMMEKVEKRISEWSNKNGVLQCTHSYWAQKILKIFFERSTLPICQWISKLSELLLLNDETCLCSFQIQRFLVYLLNWWLLSACFWQTWMSSKFWWNCQTLCWVLFHPAKSVLACNSTTTPEDQARVVFKQK